MRIRETNLVGGREIELEVEVMIYEPRLKFTHLFAEGFFRFAKTRGRLDDVKGRLKAEIVSAMKDKIFEEVEKQIDEKFESEWKQLLEAFEEPKSQSEKMAEAFAISFADRERKQSKMNELCQCGHSRFQHIHLNSYASGIPQGEPTYCGFSDIGDDKDSCPCEKFLAKENE